MKKTPPAQTDKWTHHCLPDVGRCGYEQQGDRYRIAPSRAHEFERAAILERAIATLTAAHQEGLMKFSQEVAEIRLRVWDSVYLDLGLTRDEWRLQYVNGIVTKTPIPKEPNES